jgi:hypothetical protein
MRHTELSRLTLLLNSACFFAGITAYSTIATSAAIVETLLGCMIALLGSAAAGYYIAKREFPRASADEQHDPASVLIKIIIFFPIVLTIFELVVLFYLAVKPEAVQWVHIVIAGYVGQGIATLLCIKGR